MLISSGEGRPLVLEVCSEREMTVKIFLDDKSFHQLKKSVPRRSASKLVIDKAVRLKFFAINTVISCDEIQARNLLLYASHHPGLVASIHRAFLSAGVSLDCPEANPANDCFADDPAFGPRPRKT
jgi:hypothetical protein